MRALGSFALATLYLVGLCLLSFHSGIHISGCGLLAPRVGCGLGNISLSALGAFGVLGVGDLH